MDELTIDYMYSCSLCGISQAHVAVRARTTEENVVEWLEGVAAPAMGEDHARRSPSCHPKKLSEIRIPITGSDMVGGPCVQ